jgi:hypothetical protein
LPGRVTCESVLRRADYDGALYTCLAYESRRETFVKAVASPFSVEAVATFCSCGFSALLRRPKERNLSDLRYGKQCAVVPAQLAGESPDPQKRSPPSRCGVAAARRCRYFCLLGLRTCSLKARHRLDKKGFDVDRHLICKRCKSAAIRSTLLPTGEKQAPS